MKFPRDLALVAALLALAAAGCSGQLSAQAPKGGAGPPPPTKVLVTPAVRDQVAAKRTFVGTVRPIRRSIVGSAAPGRVEKLEVNEGDYIEAGKPIAHLRRGIIQAELDAAKGQLKVREAELGELVESRQDEIEQAKAQLATAQAQLTFRKAKLERARALGQSISRELLEEEIAAATAAAATQHEAEASLRLIEGSARDQKTEVARGWVAAQTAEVARLEEQLDRHTMYAPFNGYVSAEHTEQGQWVMQGDPVAEIVELGEIDVEISVLEDFIGRLDRSTKYDVEVPALPGEIFPGTIALIVPQADARARTFPVKIRVPNQMVNNQPLLKAGMLARVTLEVSDKVDSVLVHKDAIVLGGATPVIYVASALGDKSQARLVPVELGPENEGWIVVKGQVQEGDLAVVEGNERIRPDQPVRAVEREERYPRESEAQTME